MSINKSQLKLRLSYCLHDLYDILTVEELIMRENKYRINPIQRKKYDKQLCKVFGSFQCINDMYYYFNIKNTDNILYNLIYHFSTIKDFDSKLSLLSKKDLLIPNYILYPNEYIDGYDKIIKKIMEELL